MPQPPPHALCTVLSELQEARAAAGRASEALAQTDRELEAIMRCAPEVSEITGARSSESPSRSAASTGTRT